MDYSSNRAVEKEFLLREKYNGVKNSAYDADVVRIENGEPLAYVIGFVPFLDCKIFLDSRPLIPRPETEFWVEAILQKLKAESWHPPRGLQFVSNRFALGQIGSLKAVQKPLRFLDLFAGSGCVGVALLKHIPDVQVDFGEIDTNHFSTITKNIWENDIEETRTAVIRTDVWDGITNSYDIVCANPPYLSESRLNLIEPSVLAYEPKKALFADENGFALIRRLILKAGAHLNPKGLMYIEHEPEHAEMIQKCAKEHDFSAETKQDQYGVLRYSILKRV
ncbi:MAG: HemK/PrmC family methyltransferase [Candidatus Paceibacterota bacterium]